MDPAEENGRRFRVDFIDPLFAICLSWGFTEALLLEEWFRTWKWPDGTNRFEFATFFLGLITLIASWLGYHRSIQKRPLSGDARFYLDIVIVLVYGIILLKYENLQAVLLLMALAYVLFLAWDLAKLREYEELTKRGSVRFLVFYRRQLVTFEWMGFYIALFVSHARSWIGPGWALGLAFFGTFGYRWHKEHEVWAPLFKSADRKFFGRGSNP